MSIGNSGRIVIEIEPALKRELHDVLRKDGTTMRAWFLEKVDGYLAAKSQPALPFDFDNSNKTREAKG